MTTGAPEPIAPTEASRDRKPALQEIVLLALLALSAVGVAISQVAPEKAFGYWLAMVPIFGGVSLFQGWSSARASGMTVADVMRRQVLHWGALALAVCLIFLLESTDRVGEAVAGIMTLLTLALATFLAGVHFDWRYYIVGGLLAAAVAAIAVLANFLWVIGIAAAGFAVYLGLRARRSGGG